MKEQKNFMFKLKIKLISLKYKLLFVAHIIALLLIGFMFDHFIEMVTMIPLFYIFTKMYDKQYHKNTVLKCVCFTLIIFTIICIFTPTKHVSLFVSVFSMYALTTISYYAKDYIDKLNVLNKKLESMSVDEMKVKFTNYTDYEIKAAHAYINRGDKLADNIAMKYNYSTRQIQRIVKRMRDELK